MNAGCGRESCLRNKERLHQLEEENARLKAENLRLKEIHESIKVLVNGQEVKPPPKEGMEPDISNFEDSDQTCLPDNFEHLKDKSCYYVVNERAKPEVTDFDSVQHVSHVMCPKSYDDFEELNCVNASTPAHKGITNDTEEDPHDNHLLHNEDDPDETRLPDLDDARFEDENAPREPAITSFDRLPSRQEQNSKFAYKAKLPRKRSERMQLPGQTCNDCENAYDLLELTGKERERTINRCSRHRGQYKRTRSPPGYWDLDLTLMKQNRY